MATGNNTKQPLPVNELRKSLFVGALVDEIQKVFLKYDGHIDDVIIRKALSEASFLYGDSSGQQTLEQISQNYLKCSVCGHSEFERK